VGFGAAFDAKRSGDGLARAMYAALNDAQIEPGDIDHVNAHGLGTPEADVWEARAIQRVFGACREPVPVVALKSFFGNLGAGSGTSELIGSLLGMQQGQVARTLNYDQPDPECPVAVTREQRVMKKDHFLKIGFTDLGQCAAIVCRRWTA
jgi:3-oxoacyl-[acyl-carrier-protein] synthase II